MTDIETLGANADSTIFQISAIAFNIATGEHISKFNQIADISKNASYEMNVSGSTLQWWLRTNKELFTKLLNDGVGSSSELMESFHVWLCAMATVGDIHLWGNGILFDNNMIKTQLETLGLGYPVKYNKDRDLRTLVDLASVKLGLSEKELRAKVYDGDLTAHDAMNDVVNQIAMVMHCYKELTDHVEFN